MAHEHYAEADITDMDTDNYWYIIHTVCAGGEAGVLLVDADAPEKAENGITVGYDSENDSYVYELRLKDTTWTDTKVLPTTKPGQANADRFRLNYAANGITSAFWTVGNLAGDNTANADAEAVKPLDEISAEPDNNGLYDKAVVTLLADGSSNVQGGLTAKVVVTVPRELVEANRTSAVWVYAKDGVNNTIKIPIPLNENIIDVSVPIQVDVIALKKTGGGSAELLAPECYIVNNSEKQIKAEVSGFTTTTAQNVLSLSTKAKGETFAANEISLFIKTMSQNKAVEANVTTITADKPFTIGVLGKKSTDDRTISFTFDASYDAQNINEPDGFIKNVMSWHFTVVEEGTGNGN